MNVDVMFPRRGEDKLNGPDCCTDSPIQTPEGAIAKIDRIENKCDACVATYRARVPSVNVSSDNIFETSLWQTKNMFFLYFLLKMYMFC